MYRFKSLTTKHYIDGVKNNDWQPFDKHLWQKSFYDHIIRTDTSLEHIRKYIQTNPSAWDQDESNPGHNQSMQGTVTHNPKAATGNG